MANIPNELLVQVERQSNFEKLNIAEKIKELNWCIERCSMNLVEYPEKFRYYKSQLRQLKKLLIEIKKT